MKTFVLLVCLLTGFASAQPGPVAVVDPILGPWRLSDGRIMKFRVDRTAAIWLEGERFMNGVWEVDPFSDGLRRYAVRWDNGQLYDLELAKDASAIRGTRKDGTAISGGRTSEIWVHIRSDDHGGFSVNGREFIRLPADAAKERIFVTKGNVLTVELKRGRGKVGFVLEAFEGNRNVFSARHFYYAVAANPDWKTASRMFGFRSPLTTPLKGFALESVKDPLIAIPQNEDDKYDRLHFKYVVR